MPVEVGGPDGGRIDEVARFRAATGARVNRHWGASRVLGT
jgi:hypothetical protein